MNMGRNIILISIVVVGMWGCSNVQKTGASDRKTNKSSSSSDAVMKAGTDLKTGQAIIEENGKRVLQYNYKTVHLEDVVLPGGRKHDSLKFSKMSGPYYHAYLNLYPEYPKDTMLTSAVYSIPRSDYIHPLYGLNGEMLTSDWPDGGHPHHRGIFWSWPEVEYKGRRGDIYALQKIFARPTGNIKYQNGAQYAQVDAENMWLWEDRDPIVREYVSIRVYRSSADRRVIDLTLTFQALEDSITIATRFTNTYGGLNVRMQTPAEQKILRFTDTAGIAPVRAWADFSGTFEGNEKASGMTILQHRSNPEYPGAWVEYPNLSWVQPTFPTPGTRYHLSREKPLTLRYRLIVHNGGKPDDNTLKKEWDTYNSGTPSQHAASAGTR